MKLYEATQIVLELAAQADKPTDARVAQEHADAIETLREFAWGYFPGSRLREQATKGT